MPDIGEKYDRLVHLYRKIAKLLSIEWTLEWDQRTNIPKGANDFRADQVALCAGLKHEWCISPEIGELLDVVESSELMSDEYGTVAANVREWRRRYDRMTKLPQSLVEDLSRTQSVSHTRWKEAREEKDFSLFQPWLEKIFDLTRQMTDYIGYDTEPYDALIDEYEPGAVTSEVASILGDLKESLPPLVESVKGSSRKPRKEFLSRKFPIDAQQGFLTEVAAAIGYDFNRGRLDATVHPFCTCLGPSDIRITTRYNERSLLEALFGGLHETGHALYDQNTPLEHWGTPRGDSWALGIHESQSLLWENFVGRSLGFWEYWYPKAQQYFSALEDVSLEEFHFAVNVVEPSFIRIDADELTYNLHIALRFELERSVLNGELKVSDIPEAWNANFESYLGLEVPNDALGCLQDIHWSSGLIGYFPTFSLGNMNAAQFYECAQAELGDLDDMFRRGEFLPLLEWLTRNIHSRGMKYDSAKLTEVVTGKPLSPDALIEYFGRKYGALYEFNL